MSGSKAQTQTSGLTFVTAEGAKMLKRLDVFSVFSAFTMVISVISIGSFLNSTGASFRFTFIAGIILWMVFGGAFFLLNSILTALVKKLYEVKPPVRSYDWTSQKPVGVRFDPHMSSPPSLGSTTFD